MGGVYCGLLGSYGNGCIWSYGVTAMRLDVKLKVSFRNERKCNIVQVMVS